MAAEVRVYDASATSTLVARARVHRFEAEAGSVAVRVYDWAAVAEPIAATVVVARLSVAAAGDPGDGSTLQRRAGQWVPRQLLTRVDGAWL